MTLDDGSTVSITVTVAGTFRIQGKKVAYAFTTSFQNFGGTQNGAKNRAQKAADIIAKKIGVRV